MIFLQEIWSRPAEADVASSLMFGQLTKIADLDTVSYTIRIKLFCDASVRAMDTMLKQMVSPMQLPLHKLGIKRRSCIRTWHRLLPRLLRLPIRSIMPSDIGVMRLN